jgi:Icc protein
LFSIWLTSACLRPAEDRVEADRDVGHARLGGVEVDVSEGHAAVRSLDESRAVLWAGAPTLELALTLGAASRTFDVEIQNAMPRGRLRVTRPSGVAPVELESNVPTRKQYRLEAVSGELELEFATPESEQLTPFRIALMSDVQEAIDRVSDVFDRINREPDLEFLLGAGDLTERGSREELERYQRELLGLQIPYYTTLGNHELGQDPTLYHEYFGRGNQSFEYRGVFFTLIDSASATLDVTTYEWLDGWLDRARDDVHLISMHIPPIDPIGVRNGSFASRAEASKLLGSLARAEVDLTVYGHIHSYYQFENAGIPAYISGGGGAIPERFDGIGRHFMVFELAAGEGVGEREVVRVD